MKPCYSLADYFRLGHSICLEEHVSDPRPMLHSRSSAVLKSRGPALPVNPVDLSQELIDETKLRRSLHSRIISEDPAAFRRKTRGESAASLLKTRHEVKDLLDTMHPFKDTNDIDPHKKYTFSVRSVADLLEKERKETEALQNLKPLDDFLRPDDPYSPRSTGYEHGHIRSLLKLDIYGPNNSLKASKERQTGKLPLEPNVDRHARFVAPSMRSPSSALGSPYSPSQSRASTASSSTPSSSALPRIPGSETFNFTATLGGAEPGARSLKNTMPLSLRRSKDMQSSRVEREDRLRVDAFVRRKDYFHTYQQKLRDEAAERDLRLALLRQQREREELAQRERQRTQDFEKHVVLAKFNSR